MAASDPHEVVLQIPDIGLDDKQIGSLRKTFHNQFVTTLGEKAAAVRVVQIRIRIIRTVE